MKVLLKKLFFIISFILYYIKSSETIPLWKNESEVSYINGNRYSYSFDGETGAEIYLLNGNLNYYSPTTQMENKTKIPDNIINVDNLIEMDSTFYFSINSQIFAWIDNSEIKYKNPDQIEGLSDYKIKCLRDNKNILVAFLGTEYLFWFNSETKEYIFNYTNTDSMNFLGINYYSYDSDDNEFIVLSKKNNNYQFNICKKSYGYFQCDKERIISESEINIYDNKEIITTGEIAYIFSYDSDSSSFSFYLINLAKPNTVGFIDGKYYFRFFNDFKIKYAKFIKGSPLLYYSIEESLKKDKKSYIGVADLRYYLLLYNIEENVIDKLYFFYGNGYNNLRRLFYFKGTKKYCIVLL